MKRILALLLALTMALSLLDCGSSKMEPAAPEKAPEASAEATPDSSAQPVGDVAALEEAAPVEEEEVTIYIDIAASLEAVFVDVIIPAFEAEYPNVTVQYNTGSSGKLLTGIEEAKGIGHDLFFSAGKKQVTTLDEADGLVVDGSIVNLLSNQLCLVTGKDTETAVTGWDNIADAGSMALCGGSVPVGKYSRLAFVSLGLLEEIEDASRYTTEEIAAALGGAIEIDEADDVEVAAAKVVEGACEIATIYYSDYYNHSEDLTILAQDDGSLTGRIVYPVCLIANAEATEEQSAAAAVLLAFLQKDICLEAFADYCFIVNE